MEFLLLPGLRLLALSVSWKWFPFPLAQHQAFSRVSTLPGAAKACQACPSTKLCNLHLVLSRQLLILVLFSPRSRLELQGTHGALLVCVLAHDKARDGPNLKKQLWMKTFLPIPCVFRIWVHGASSLGRYFGVLPSGSSSRQIPVC